jgi:alanyl-tRNA synthetase
LNEKKETLRSKFSADYKRYYLVDLFKREGFVRKKCENCGRYFWTIDQERKRCDDQPCSQYSFIGSPPTSKKLDKVGSWKAIERFFERNGHASVKRYPVVSRWRPDLYFTVASIIDFQRVEAGRVVFQLPANPLVVPQMCMRFNDIPNVGVSGKHYTSFVMVGQHSIADRRGYWKDRCIDLDFQLMTKEFGIDKEEVTFNEEVWVGYGAFGYSLEFFVRGLELGNAVFTAFEGDIGDYREMKEKVVDMGTGLERWAWLSQGTPTSYDANFSSVLRKMKEETNVEVDRKLFLTYSKLAGTMNVDEFGSLNAQRAAVAKKLGVDPIALEAELAPLEATYAIADHAQTLLFGIADGMLPSNSGGGYNLRILFRRAMGFINHHGFQLSLADVVNWHIDYLKGMYPELEEHRGDVEEVLKVEESRYSSSNARASKIVSSITTGGKSITTDDLIRLYDSDGVTPEQLMEAGAKVDMPEDFYEKVQARHIARKFEEPKPAFPIDRLSPTRLLYYEDETDFDFKARVLKVFHGNSVVLNRTAFYPRGGGQEPDKGTIGTAKVVDVEKYNDIVIHKLEGKAPKAGSTVECHVDSRRRRRITQIHTATHILNGSSRQTLGPWVWQHSAFKEEDYGRIDITHFSHLTEQEVQKIEDLANEIVRKNLTIKNTFMPRQQAEEKYGFRLYQGGVVPGRTIRVVDIGGWDIEACGGTHAKKTGEVGLIKITKAERIQDGVERLEFVAGEAAIEYMHRMDSELQELSKILGTQRENLQKVVGALQDDLAQARAREKSLSRKVVELSSSGSTTQESTVNTALGDVNVTIVPPGDLADEELIAQGQKVVQASPSTVYIGFAPQKGSTRIICFVGEKAAASGYSASEIVRKLASTLRGSGGGTPSFAQGGGPETDMGKIGELIKGAPEVIRGTRK